MGELCRFLEEEDGVTVVEIILVLLVLIALVLIDMWAIDKRYLSGKDFVTNQEFTSVLNKRAVDDYILENDKDPDYRVLDLTVDPFNNAYISYHHKTVGGYSPAKLQRYQDLIDRYIRKEISDLGSELQGVSTYDEAATAIGYHPVLSMLNTRYFIISPETAPLANPYAQGNCWFVDNIVEAENADGEISTLGTIDPRRQAVVSKDFIAENPGLKDINRGGGAQMDSTTATSVANDFASISLMNYAPNKLTYHYSSATPQAAIFSEVYYPGWKAVLKTADGKENELKTLKLLRTKESEENKRLFSAIEEDYMDIPNRRERYKEMKKSPWFNALQVKFAYALTCHKTQGGQWSSVFIDSSLNQKETLEVEDLRWLYTALTRAQERVYFVNFKEEFFEE